MAASRASDGEGTKKIDYEALAATYARYRAAVPRVVGFLIEAISGVECPSILEVGCGTADHAAALADVLGRTEAAAAAAAAARTGARVVGFDISPAMLEQARAKHPGLALSLGDAERGFPYGDAEFDLAFSVNVVHYLKDLAAHFREARRVLRPGGLMITVTDSEDDIRGRTMTRYFPGIVDAESQRYHSVATLTGAMAGAGFHDISVGHTRHASAFGEPDMDRFRRRAFSALRLIPDEAYKRGLAQLEAEYAAGPLELLELYTYVVGRA